MHRRRTRTTLTIVVFLFSLFGLLGLAPAADAASARISGRITLPDGSPAKDFLVLMDTSGTSESWHGRTNSNGEFRSAALSTSHTFNVHVLVGNAPQYGNQIRWHVKPGTSGVNFKLRTSGEKIYGKVTDAASGKAIGGMRVSAFDTGDKSPWTFRVTTSNSDGTYELPLLDPGDFTVYYNGGVKTYTKIASGKNTKLNLTVGNGYWIANDRGGLYEFGDVGKFKHNSFATRIVSVAPTPSGEGVWLLDALGKVITYGDAKYHGDYKTRRAKGIVGKADLVDISPTRGGDGYYILDSAGGIHTFGDAKYFGSIPAMRQRGVDIGQAEVMALAPTTSGNGYWILDSAGGMFTFGDADYRGSIPAMRRRGVDIGQAKVIGMAPTASGKGYWLTDDKGGVFTFGDASYKGSVPAMKRDGKSVTSADMVDMSPSQTGNGYYVLGLDGSLYGFGDARHQGDYPALGLNGPATAIVLGP